MNSTFYNTLIFICALVVGGIILVFSVRPSTLEKKVLVENNKKVWSKITLTSPQKNVYKISEEVIDVSKTKVSQDTPMVVDFGRLSSFLFLAPIGSYDGVLTQSGSNAIVLGNTSGIVSLYDLFLSYTIYDKANTFRLEQITNGSFYVGKEKDGKVAIYAIDGVIRLTLISQGEDMTNLMLFPGSYIRFDPTRNRSLNNADLFRTILSLKDTDNEVFEFVNPRVNIGDEQDTFFNYRLPNSSIPLFRVLSAKFKSKVDAKNIMREKYGLYNYDENAVPSNLLKNPSKENHNMLVELSYLLSKALDSNTNSDVIIGKIGALYKQASALDIENSTAKSLVEQFLLDGRFAQYGGVVSPKYQQTYENIAKIIGIERTDAKGQLFQNLADIYSRNLFNQKSTDIVRVINTYTPTASELVKTLDRDEIPQKDYFDIAIYAFNILRKMEEKSQFLNKEAMMDNSTYMYLTTFFRASNRYISSIDDNKKKQETIMSFSRQFYDYILTVIVNSLYKSFIVARDGALYPDPEFTEGTKIKIPQELLDNIMNLEATVQTLTPAIQSLWSGSGKSDTDAYARIGYNILRISALSTMLDPDRYKEYTTAPYKLDPNSKELSLPLIDSGSNLLVKMDTKAIEKIAKNRILLTDPRIQDLKKIWSDIDPSMILIEGDNLRVEKAPFKIGRSKQGASTIEMSSLYKDKNFTDTIIYYDDYTIRVVTEQPLSLQAFKGLLLQIESYLDFIDSEVTAQNREVGEMRIFPAKQRMNIGDSIYPVNVKSN